MNTVLQNIDRLPPDEFERFALRLLWRLGLFNIQRYGGSGDRGRDLIAESSEVPLPGIHTLRRWVIQCKRHSNAPSKGVLYDELASAAQHRPDYYLLLATFTLTAAQSDWLSDIQHRYPFRIIVAAADTLTSWFVEAPDIAFDFQRRIGPRSFTDVMSEMVHCIGGLDNVVHPVLQILSDTLALAYASSGREINTLHILGAMSRCQFSTARQLLEDAGLPPRAANIAGKLTRVPALPPKPSPVLLSENSNAALTDAARFAKERTRPVTDLDLLTALLQNKEYGAALALRTLGVDIGKLSTALQAQEHDHWEIKYLGFPNDTAT
jgi:hypothetical protein